MGSVWQGGAGQGRAGQVDAVDACGGEGRGVEGVHMEEGGVEGSEGCQAAARCLSDDAPHSSRTQQLPPCPARHPSCAPPRPDAPPPTPLGPGYPTPVAAAGTPAAGGYAGWQPPGTSHHLQPQLLWLQGRLRPRHNTAPPATGQQQQQLVRVQGCATWPVPPWDTPPAKPHTKNHQLPPHPSPLPTHIASQPPTPTHLPPSPCHPCPCHPEPYSGAGPSGRGRRRRRRAPSYDPGRCSGAGCAAAWSAPGRCRSPGGRAVAAAAAAWVAAPWSAFGGRAAGGGRRGAGGWKP